MRVFVCVGVEIWFHDCILADVQCRYQLSSPGGTILGDEARLSPSTGTVDFDDITISSTLGAAGTLVTLSIVCDRSVADETFQTSTTVEIAPPHVQLISFAQLGSGLAKYRVEIQSVLNGTVYTADSFTQCIADVEDVPGSGSVSTAVASVTNNQATALRGLVTFPELGVQGVIGTSYRIVFKCSLGSVE